MTEMETIETNFHKYPSIENTYQEEFINRIRMNGYADIKYFITEKIHGSNTQIAYDLRTGEFTYGRRTAPLEDGEKCYNVQSCFDKIKDNVIELAEYLKPSVQAITKSELLTVIVFGEVFGGSYPHKDVPKDNHASRVQKGVFYSNHNQWKAFDVAYTVAGSDRLHFLSGFDFFTACGAVGIDTVPLLAVVNNLDEALAYANNGTSIVYKNYDLPELENNIMEGVVIKPWNADIWIGQHRLALKNKSEAYKEKSHEKKIDVQKEYSENVKKALEGISAYITENRVNNVISHEGEVTVKDIGKIIGLSAKDAVEDFKKESPVWNLLEKAEEKIVTKAIQAQMAALVRKVILGG